MTDLSISGKIVIRKDGLHKPEYYILVPSGTIMAIEDVLQIFVGKDVRFHIYEQGVVKERDEVSPLSR